MFSTLRYDDSIEKTLKSITTFGLINNKDLPYKELIDRVIADNNLERVISNSRRSLLGALSIAIFHQDGRDEEILMAAKSKLMELMNSNKWPMRLRVLKNDRLLAKDVLVMPLEPEYQRYFFDLISLAFQKKICVCSVPPYNQILNEIYYANGFEEEVKIFKNHKGDFDALFTQGKFETYIVCRDLLIERINKVLMLNCESERKASNSRA